MLFIQLLVTSRVPNHLSTHGPPQKSQNLKTAKDLKKALSDRYNLLFASETVCHHLEERVQNQLFASAKQKGLSGGQLDRL